MYVVIPTNLYVCIYVLCWWFSLLTITVSNYICICTIFVWRINDYYYYPTINTDNYATAGNTYHLEQHELTTGTNAPIYTLLLAGIHTKGESEKSKYILMVLPSRIMSSIWPNLSVFFNNFEIKICHGKHHKNGEIFFFQTLSSCRI